LRTSSVIDIFILLIPIILCAGCAHVGRLSPGWEQVGIASWYGKDFHGKPTASGEIYNMYGLSAAHRTLPLGTRVKVTNLSTGRHLVVTINDRGPFVRPRIIDMSYGAARRLGMVETGLVMVRIKVIEVPFRSTSMYTIQFGAFKDIVNARDMVKCLEDMGYKPCIEKVDVYGQAFYRVRLGRFSDIGRATKVARGFESAGVTCLVMGL